MDQKILNLKPPKPKFVLQNWTSNLPNHPKKTKPWTSNQVRYKSNLFAYVEKMKALAWDFLHHVGNNNSIKEQQINKKYFPDIALP